MWADFNRCDGALVHDGWRVSGGKDGGRGGGRGCLEGVRWGDAVLPFVDPASFSSIFLMDWSPGCWPWWHTTPPLGTPANRPTLRRGFSRTYSVIGETCAPPPLSHLHPHDQPSSFLIFPPALLHFTQFRVNSPPPAPYVRIGWGKKSFQGEEKMNRLWESLQNEVKELMIDDGQTKGLTGIAHVPVVGQMDLNLRSMILNINRRERKKNWCIKWEDWDFVAEKEDPEPRPDSSRRGVHPIKPRIPDINMTDIRKLNFR